MKDEKVILGRINAGHGLKGWVKIFSYTDPLEQILAYSPWTLRRRGIDKEVEVEQGRKQGKGVVALIAGSDDRDQADALVGNEIWVARSQLPAVAPGEYYWYQLQGLVIRNLDNELLGCVEYLMETGAHDVMVVAPTAASIDEKQRLIPFADDDIVKEVDLEGGQILVDWQADY